MSHKKRFQNVLAPTLIAALWPAASAFAASGTSSVTFPDTPRISYVAPIAQLSKTDPAIKSRILNWTQPSMTLTFDLSEADIIDNLELLLTADPLSKVSRTTPISVQFNNDVPIRIATKGQGFDSRIRLNTSRVRAKNNIIKITYETPRGSNCVTPDHGAWLVNLKHSKLVVNGRARTRAMQLREVEMRLEQPAIAPKRVGLIATGDNATTLQALAAQAIGLRMDDVPNYTTQRGASDFEVIMARRDELHQYTRDKALLNSEGPRIYVPRSRPMKMIITGDSDAQVLETVKSFATFQLPSTRRQQASLGEIYMQPRLANDSALVTRKTKLSNLPGFHYGSSWQDKDWASRPQALRFNVSDPAASSGEIVLKLSAGRNVDQDSKLRLALNGQSLGSANIDQARQTAHFSILPGMLRGIDNVITLTPELKASLSAECPASGNIDAEFHIGGGSAIVLNQTSPSPISDLSRLAATGAPFSDHAGSESYIALPENAAQYNASLKVLARLAKTSQKGLTEAIYRRSGDMALAQDKHVLMIGDRSTINPALRRAAPEAFAKALKGQAVSGDNLVTSAYNQYASSEATISLQAAARSHAKMSRINAGGIATLFGHQDYPGRVIGIISNTPGQSFTRIADQISHAERWNELEGGVARWNRQSVLMAQTAAPIIGYKAPANMAAPELPSLTDMIADIEMPDKEQVQLWAQSMADKAGESLSNLMANIRNSQKNIAAKPSYETLPEPKMRAFSDIPKWPSETRNAAYKTLPSDLPELRGPSRPDAPFKMDLKDSLALRFDQLKLWSNQKWAELSGQLSQLKQDWNKRSEPAPDTPETQ